MRKRSNEDNPCSSLPFLLSGTLGALNRNHNAKRVAFTSTLRSQSDTAPLLQTGQIHPCPFRRLVPRGVLGLGTQRTLSALSWSWPLGYFCFRILDLEMPLDWALGTVVQLHVACWLHWYSWGRCAARYLLQICKPTPVPAIQEASNQVGHATSPVLTVCSASISLQSCNS